MSTKGLRDESRQWVAFRALMGASFLLRIVSPSLDFPFTLTILACSCCVFAHVVSRRSSTPFFRLKLAAWYLVLLASVFALATVSAWALLVGVVAVAATHLYATAIITYLWPDGADL